MGACSCLKARTAEPSPATMQPAAGRLSDHRFQEGPHVLLARYTFALMGSIHEAK